MIVNYVSGLMFVKVFTETERNIINDYKPNLMNNFYYDMDEDNEIVGIYYYFDNDEDYFNLVILNLFRLLLNPEKNITMKDQYNLMINKFLNNE